MMQLSSRLFVRHIGGRRIEVWPVLALGGVGVLKVLWVGIGIIGIEVWCGIGGVEWAYLLTSDNLWPHVALSWPPHEQGSGWFTMRRLCASLNRPFFELHKFGWWDLYIYISSAYQSIPLSSDAEADTLFLEHHQKRCGSPFHRVWHTSMADKRAFDLIRHYLKLLYVCLTLIV